MNYYRFFISFLYFTTIISITSPVLGVFFLSDHDEAEFAQLGQRFPSVGRLKSSSAWGSGTLIDTGQDSLNGRVVLTCAHNFDDEKPEDMSFTLDGKKYCKGIPFIHPKYKEDLRQYHISNVNDIALFVLDEKISGITLMDFQAPIYGATLAKMNFQPPVFEKYYCFAGCGSVARIFGEEISQTNKYGAYSFASLQGKDNFASVILPDNYVFGSSLGVPDANPPLLPQGALLKLYALTSYANRNDVLFYQNENDINFEKPTGIASCGDSGGGVFNEKDELVGVVTNGTEPDWLGEKQAVTESFIKENTKFIEENKGTISEQKLSI